LTGSVSWSDGGDFVPGLLPGLEYWDAACSLSPPFQGCWWRLRGNAAVPAGTYTVRLTVTDDDGGEGYAETTIIVEPEDATLAFDGGNPVAVQVATEGGNSGLFALAVQVREKAPDLPVDRAAPGDIGNAVVSMTLVPVGPGGPVDGTCMPGPVSGTGYDAVLAVACQFQDVPVNTYAAVVTVGGGYYVGGPDEDVLVVYDPSLGFTTGGGWFYWPGTTDRTNFGYVMKYNKKGLKVKGSLLLIRHTEEGNYRIKSNALDGLSLGESDSPAFGWASFTGKCTYKDKGWEEPIGNHQFLVYVEDHNEPGAGHDQFWIEVYDGNGDLVPAMSMEPPATEHTVTLDGGNIVVPH
jgi:PKD repeat protein